MAAAVFSIDFPSVATGEIGSFEIRIVLSCYFTGLILDYITIRFAFRPHQRRLLFGDWLHRQFIRFSLIQIDNCSQAMVNQQIFLH